MGLTQVILCVCLCLLAGAGLTGAVPWPAYRPSAYPPALYSKQYRQIYAQDLGAPPTVQDPKAVVILPSGSRVPIASHHGVLDLVRRDELVTLELPSGRIVSTTREEFIDKANSSEWRGANFVIPAQRVPVDVAKEVVQTKDDGAIDVELPSGEVMSYQKYSQLPRTRDEPQDVARAYRGPDGWGLYSSLGYPYAPAPQYQGDYLVLPSTVRPSQSATNIDNSQDGFFITLGNGQRLLPNVHEAIHSFYESKKPYEVDLVNGEKVVCKSYKSLLGKLTDDRFIDSTVRVGPNINVPIQTIKAVVEAHRHSGVFVELPDGRRVLYSTFAKHRAARKKSADPGDSNEESKPAGHHAPHEVTVAGHATHPEPENKTEGHHNKARAAEPAITTESKTKTTLARTTMSTVHPPSPSPASSHPDKLVTEYGKPVTTALPENREKLSTTSNYQEVTKPSTPSESPDYLYTSPLPATTSRVTSEPGELATLDDTEYMICPKHGKIRRPS